ncbi:hypothetical protein GCM10023159_31200 [Brevibacterium yomogidense]
MLLLDVRVDDRAMALPRADQPRERNEFRLQIDGDLNGHGSALHLEEVRDDLGAHCQGAQAGDGDEDLEEQD